MKRGKFLAIICTLVGLMNLSAIEQSQARESYTISNNWRLFASVEGRGDRARNIAVPYSWSLENNALVSQTSTNFLRTLYLPERYFNNRIYLKFNGVNSIADLYINGSFVGEHRGGATAFVYDITDFAKLGETNLILLRVSSVPRNDIMPTSVEHEIFGGVYRDVELIVTPKVAISPNIYGADGVFVTTRSVDNGVAKGDVKLHFAAQESVERRIELNIYDENGVEVYKSVNPKANISQKNTMTLPFEVANASLWSPENPALYDVKVTLSSVSTGGAEVKNQRDEVVVKTGFRSVSLSADGRAKGIVRLNGEPTLLNGVSLYHDAPGTNGIMSKKLHRENLAVAQDLGANAIRSAVMPHDKALYSLCDSLGIMAWVELPFTRSQYLSDVAYFPTKEFEENGMQQLREIVYQNYNHPSVVMWGIFSNLSSRERGILKYVKSLNTECKEIDPLRPTAALSNQDGEINTITDLVAWNQNIGWENGLLTDVALWSDQLHSKWSHLRSGVMYGAGGAVSQQIDRVEIPECRKQRRDGWFPEVRQSEMHEVYSSVLAQDSLFWGVWHNTLFDFKAPRNIMGESVEGLVSYDRESKKDAYYLYRALWNKNEPTLHIADKRARMLGEGSSNITLRVYASSTKAPIAQIEGGEIREMERIAPAQYVIENIQVTDRTKITVTQGTLSDSIEFIYDSPLRNQQR